jgi:hypothetical protein
MSDMQKLVDQLAEKARGEQEEALRKAHEKQVEDLIRVLSSLYDKAAAYTNLILAAGYAGFFAVWANVKVLMTPIELRISGLSMTLSLLVFVAWEITKMIYTSRSLTDLVKVSDADAQSIDQKLLEHEKHHRRINVRLLRVWVWILAATIIPAVIAVAVLLYVFISGLFKPVGWGE